MNNKPSINKNQPAMHKKKNSWPAFVMMLGLLVTMPKGALLAQSEPSINLYPKGYGLHTFTKWTAFQGLPDSSGTNNFALYFQKMTDTAANAAAIAIIDGFNKQPTSVISGLEFERRIDGGCTATSPRFSFRIQPAPGQLNISYDIGCLEMVQSAGSGLNWERRAWPSPLKPALPIGTIVSLSIIYSDGDDFPLVSPGSVYLDNIKVISPLFATGSKTWTQP
jgi:hypothetical protein